MRITMIGSGYVGLVSGACFSDFGHDVICVDKDASKIAALERGKMPIFEPGLDQLVATNVAAGRLTFTTDLEAGGRGCRRVFIAVGTPSRRGDGHADLTYVLVRRARSAPRSTARPVVTKSTVPVGTGDEVEGILSEVAAGRRLSRSFPTRNSCAKAPRSRTSSGPTASSSAPTMRAPAR